MGGSDDPSNVIQLCPNHHAVAHMTGHLAEYDAHGVVQRSHAQQVSDIMAVEAEWQRELDAPGSGAARVAALVSASVS
jgi:hypothetical protein